MQYISSLEAAEEHISAEIFKENLHTSVKILQICMVLQDSVQRSLQSPADLHRFAKIENLGCLLTPPVVRMGAPKHTGVRSLPAEDKTPLFANLDVPLFQLPKRRFSSLNISIFGFFDSVRLSSYSFFPQFVYP